MHVGRVGSCLAIALALAGCDRGGAHVPEAQPAAPEGPRALVELPAKAEQPEAAAKAEPIAKPAAKPEPSPTPEPPESIVTRDTRPGVTVRAMILAPKGTPFAVVMLLAGGSGKIGLSAKGLGAHAQDGFLARTRERFVDAGFVVVLVDAPSDRADGLEGFRSTAEHAEDLGDIADGLRAKYPVPLWMIGVSRGTISAANAAARLGKRGPDGLVLLSPVTAGQHERLADVKLDAIATPTLIVNNRGDDCSASPPGAARALGRRFARGHAPRLLAVGARSHAPEVDPCEALTRHGYVGIEDEVVDAVIGFVRSP